MALLYLRILGGQDIFSKEADPSGQVLQEGKDTSVEVCHQVVDFGGSKQHSQALRDH